MKRTSFPFWSQLYKYKHQLSHHTTISRTSVKRILHKNEFYPYHMQWLHQELQPENFGDRTNFIEWMQEKLGESPICPQNIILSSITIFTIITM